MEIVNVHQAKTHFSKYLDEVAKGKEVFIGKHGKPIAKIVPLQAPAKRQPNSLKGKIWIADDFDDPVTGFEESITADIDAHTR